MNIVDKVCLKIGSADIPAEVTKTYPVSPVESGNETTFEHCEDRSLEFRLCRLPTGLVVNVPFTYIVNCMVEL